MVTTNEASRKKINHVFNLEISRRNTTNLEGEKTTTFLTEQNWQSKIQIVSHEAEHGNMNRANLESERERGPLGPGGVPVLMILVSDRTWRL